MKNFLKTISIASVLLPIAAQAQSLTKITNINGVSTRLAAIGNVAIYLLVSLAVIYIVWNVVYYLIRPSADDKAAAGMNILWGIVGLFVIISLWGLVNILVNTFGTNPNISPDRFPSANFISPQQNSQSTQVQSQAPSAANNYNNVTGGNENTQNYNH
jgi:heme/copper-type cytochrome/quinol oxidase subunit 4